MRVLMEENQYFRLIAWPSLFFISKQVSAGSSGIEPRGTERRRMNFVYYLIDSQVAKSNQIILQGKQRHRSF